MLINRKQNIGKAKSIRKAIRFLYKKDQFLWIGFADADLATPLPEIHSMGTFIRENPTKK